MNHARLKLTVAGLVVAAGVGVLFYAGAREGGVYYMEVDKFLADSQLHNRRVRLCGTVAEENLVIKTGEMKASFELRGVHGRLPVVYHGVIPEMFKAATDVVVAGRLGADGVFQADELLTKCASKYRPAPPASQPQPEGRS